MERASDRPSNKISYLFNSRNQLRLYKQNEIEKTKLQIFQRKMDQMKRTLVKESDREIKFTQRKRLDPLKVKMRSLAVKEKLKRQEKKPKEEVLQRVKAKLSDHSSLEPYGRWVRLPKYHKGKE